MSGNNLSRTKVVPIDWWSKKFKEEDLACLGVLPREFLAICASSAPVERFFSFGADVVSKDRSRMSAETAAKLTFVGRNAVLLKRNFQPSPSSKKNKQYLGAADDLDAFEKWREQIRRKEEPRTLSKVLGAKEINA
jgi:hypothetical protein